MENNPQSSELEVTNMSTTPWYRRWYVLGWAGVVVVSFIVLGVLSNETNQLLDRALDDIALEQITKKQNQATLLPGVGTSDDAAAVVDVQAILDTTDPTLGNPNALLVIVEFADFQCPFCKQSHSILRQFIAQHPEEVFFVYKDFPIEELHPLAPFLAEAGQCAFEQGSFWSLHDVLFQQQDAVNSEEDVYAIATSLGIDTEKLQTCINSNKYQAEVQQDLATGLQYGVVGTPTFLVNGHRLTGVVPLATWEQILEIAKQDQ